MRPFTNPHVLAIPLMHTYTYHMHTHTHVYAHTVFCGKNHNIASSWNNPWEKQRTMEKRIRMSKHFGLK